MAVDKPIPSIPSLFEQDVYCPKCTYNLRGQINPRCPECGAPFDPNRLLAMLQGKEPPPQTWWLLRNMYLHPVSIWSMPQMSGSRGTTIWQFCLAPLLGAVGLLIGLVTLAVGRPDVIDVSDVGETARNIALATAGSLLFLVPALLLHVALCWVGLSWKGCRNARAKAMRIACYPAVYLMPNLLFTVVAPLYALPTGSRALALPAAVGILASWVMWGKAIYTAALSVEPHSRGFARYCTATNPFWWTFPTFIALLGYGLSQI